MEMGVSQKKRKRRSRPCSVCGRWFEPNPRVGDRQRTCGDARCRKEQKRRTQAKWSSANAGYWTQRRLDAHVVRVEAGEVAAVRPPPAEMARIPSEAAQEAFGSQGAVIIALVVRLLLRSSQDAMGREVATMTREMERLRRALPQEAIAVSDRGS